MKQSLPVLVEESDAQQRNVQLFFTVTTACKHASTSFPYSSCVAACKAEAIMKSEHCLAILSLHISHSLQLKMQVMHVMLLHALQI